MRIADESFRFASVVLAALTLGACATLPSAPPHPGDELITYQTDPGPFCGRCDTIKFAVASNGRVWIEEGHWAGRYSDWQITRRQMHVSPEQFARFRDRLSAYRPVGDLNLDGRTCKTYETDASEVHVIWQGGGARGQLNFNFGCDPEIRSAMRESLRTAPALLGLRSPLAS